ncbi:hypothetical protein RB195_011189 [Necator americanus]|uniref:Tc1-like transposase DDE domain-containing protein n=1 Tax=Necator americanus TaxID=51031 RepID=A0ABR1D1C0_NECAM
MDKGEAPNHFPKPKTHPKKTMVTVWWCATGAIHFSFMKNGEAITAEKYCKELEEIRGKTPTSLPGVIEQKGPDFSTRQSRPHISKVTLLELNELGYETLPQPPYSPDLLPTDYHVFEHLDSCLRGKIFLK